MLKKMYHLLDMINGSLTGRDPELVRRLREELVEVSEIRALGDGLYDIGHLVPYKGVECGAPSTVKYKPTGDISYIFQENVNRQRSIKEDLTRRIFYNPNFAAVRHYIVLNDERISPQMNEATYQGIVLTEMQRVIFEDWGVGESHA
jgi:hypothetical protein